MKSVGHILIISFLYYLYVDAKKFPCPKAIPLRKDNYLLALFHHKVTWIVKYPGYADTRYNKEMLGRVYRISSTPVIYWYTYFKDSSKEQTLVKNSYDCRLHDDFFATQCTFSLHTYVKYNESQLGKSSIIWKDVHENVKNIYLALVHYDLNYDFYIFQYCHEDVAMVEVGDRTYRRIIGGNNELGRNVTASISKVLNKLGINDVNYSEPNDLLNINFDTEH